MSRWNLIDNSLESRQHHWFPHFMAGRVPLDPEANRLWRIKHFNTTNPAERKLIRKMCSEDLLFFVTGFGSIFYADPTDGGEPGPIPFIPYDFQIELFTALWDAMHCSRKSARVKKPRRLGLTWMIVFLFQHCWQFMANRHLLVGSRREEEVDGTAAISKGGSFVGEWSKMLAKFDFAQIWQPSWLLPDGFRPRTEPYRVRMKIMNPENGSMVWGTSAASTAGRQERGYAAFWDEAAHTENLYEIIGGLSKFSPSKFWVSSIANIDHAFSTTLRESPGTVQLEPQWWMHPDYGKNLTIDPVTGKRSSPWLIAACDELGNDPLLCNMEIHADESQQVGGYYATGTYLTMTGGATPTVMPPLHVGELDIVEREDRRHVTRFCPQLNGRWSFWQHFDREGRPPRNTRYIFGIDTAGGTMNTGGRGASKSVVAVADWMTGELVCEFVTDGVQPLELAWIVEAMGHWFEGDDHEPALVVPESNGPGGQLVDALVRKLHYNRVWQKDITKLEYGWFKDGRGQDARLAFGLHQEMICDGRFKERSAECVREMRHYQHSPTGKGAPVHSAALLSDDPSDKGENHGDRVISRLCICQALQTPYETLRQSGRARYGSYRYAKEQDEMAAQEGELIGTPSFLR
jgi:hypothetical protein